MGGKVPRQIKEKVILQWIMGEHREKIARKNGIGAGTVSAIIKEAREQKEYSDIELLRAISIAIKDEGLELGELGFAIRTKKMMEEYTIREDQLELIIQDIITYGFKHSISGDTLIRCGYEAMCLAEEFGVSVEKLPDAIVQNMKLIGKQENDLKELTTKFQSMEARLQWIVDEIEKYGNMENLICHLRKVEDSYDYKERQVNRLMKHLENPRNDIFVKVRKTRNKSVNQFYDIDSSSIYKNNN